MDYQIFIGFSVAVVLVIVLVFCTSNNRELCFGSYYSTSREDYEGHPDDSLFGISSIQDEVCAEGENLQAVEVERENLQRVHVVQENPGPSRTSWPLSQIEEVTEMGTSIISAPPTRAISASSSTNTAQLVDPDVAEISASPVHSTSIDTESPLNPLLPNTASPARSLRSSTVHSLLSTNIESPVHSPSNPASPARSLIASPHHSTSINTASPMHSLSNTSSPARSVISPLVYSVLSTNTESPVHSSTNTALPVDSLVQRITAAAVVDPTIIPPVSAIPPQAIASPPAVSPPQTINIMPEIISSPTISPTLAVTSPRGNNPGTPTDSDPFQ